MHNFNLPIEFPENNIVEILSDRKKQNWEFCASCVSNVPSPDSDNQDIGLKIFNSQSWVPVIVPGSLEMQGFELKNNTEYYYRTTVTIPEFNKSEEIYIRFEGVYSNARIWANGKFVRKHIGGFTPFDCDVTNYSGTTITLVVGVADIEGKEKGIYNPTGKIMSDASWASFYAHHNIGGILRDVVLYKVSKERIENLIIDTVPIDREYKNWKMCVSLQKPNELTISCTMLSSEGIVVFENEFKSNSLEINVSSPTLWNAEQPYLYTLNISLLKSGAPIHKITKQIGFRHISFNGSESTEKNKVYVNGKEIKLKGVCRHDVSFEYGRSISKEETKKELEAYKNCNVNFLRTSHYPASEYMLQLADSMGFYVEQENAACFKGANGYGVDCPDSEFTEEFAEMIAYSRNHPSVIIWSLANESDFQKAKAFRQEYNYVKSVDKTRPVIFSYPKTVKSKPLTYDIFSFHYQKVNKNVGKRNIPVLHDEFAHVACYNIENLKNDNSSRVFWTESVLKGWENIYKTNGALGCAVWAARDDVFFLPETVSEKHQKHSDGSAAGYGEWGAVLDCFGREKPEAYILKKVFSPVKIRCFHIDNNCISFKAENRFCHTDLALVNVECECDGKSNLYNRVFSKTLPGETAKATIYGKFNAASVIKLRFYFNNLCVEEFVYKKEKITSPTYDGFKEVPFEPANIKSTAIKGKQVKRVKILTKNKQNNLHLRIIAPLHLRRPTLRINIPLGENVSHIEWKTNPFAFEFPESHIGRTSGICYADDYVFTPYGERSDCDWSKDAFNYFLFEKNETLPLLSNDFKTKRSDINFYRVHFKDGSFIEITPDKVVTNCLTMAKFENGKKLYFLEISFERYYDDLKWGNYYGKIKLSPGSLFPKVNIKKFAKN